MRAWVWIGILALLALLGFEMKGKSESASSLQKQKPAMLSSKPSLQKAGSKNFLSPNSDQTSHREKSSLDGTDVDGALKENENKELVVDQDVRHLFDYFLSLIGEKPIEDVKAGIEKEVDHQLGPKAAAEAKELLQRYLNYKKFLQSGELHLDKAEMNVEDLQDRLKILKNARQDFFTASEIEGLFGIDEDYALDSLERMEIIQNVSLSEEEKQEKMRTLDQAMEPALREARRMTLLPLEFHRKEIQMRELGASEEDIERAREEALGSVAAKRWKAVEQEQTLWKQRVSAYRDERDKILQAMGSAEGAQATLQALRDRFFSAQEQRRLSAWE